MARAAGSNEDVGKRPRRPKGEGGYTRRADGSFQFAIDLGKDASGKRQRRYIYAKTKAELQRKVVDERARSGGSIQSRAPGTVGAWLDRWLAEAKGTLGPNSWRGYEATWRLHASPLIGHIQLSKFDIEHVERLYAALRDRGVSPNIVGSVAKVLHRAFEVAIRKRVFNRANPFSLVDRPRVAPARSRGLEAHEVSALLAASATDRLEALWYVLATTGLRLGEALALRWTDLDFNRRTISISRSFIEVDGHVEIGETKTRSSRRLVTFGPSCAAALKRRRNASLEEDHGSPLIFPSTRGTPMRRGNVRRSHFLPLCQRAGVTETRIHDLRHAMTPLALAGGVPVKAVSERLGHSTSRLTLDRYAHVIGDLQALAAEAIEGALLSGPTSASSKAQSKK